MAIKLPIMDKRHSGSKKVRTFVFASLLWSDNELNIPLPLEETLCCPCTQWVISAGWLRRPSQPTGSTDPTFLKQPAPGRQRRPPLCFFTWDNLHSANFFHSDTSHQSDFLKQQPMLAKKVSTYHLTCSRLEEKAFSSAFSPGPLFHSTHFFILPLFNFSVCPFFHSALFHQSNLPQITCACKEGPPLCFHVPWSDTYLATLDKTALIG